ncbi:MAG: hypothetical protein GW788_00305, partial [Ignavibacteria bacterium]|nr:hypothetical protein [Ignavibacteria bacterium]
HRRETKLSGNEEDDFNQINLRVPLPEADRFVKEFVTRSARRRHEVTRRAYS